MRHETRRLVAENEIALAANRAMFELTAVSATLFLTLPSHPGPRWTGCTTC